MASAHQPVITLAVTAAGSGYPASLFAPSELKVASGKTTVLRGIYDALRRDHGLPGQPLASDVQIELRYYAASLAQESRAVPWIPTGPGALGVLLGLRYDIPRRNR